MKDLVVLVADKNMQAMLGGALARFEALDIRRLGRVGVRQAQVGSIGKVRST